MVKFRNPHHITPPGGSISQHLSHPISSSRAIELAVFQEHRYAFFYWLQWRRKTKSSEPPCLVSLDWHQDLCYPCEVQKEWLSKLDQSDDGQVAIFAWSKLCGNNDDHILSAAYLNLIGNIYVHCRQCPYADAWNDEEFIDMYGNSHKIKKFNSYEGLEECLMNSNEGKVFFDIDLDFFTKDNPYSRVGEQFTYVTDEEFDEMLSIDRPLIEWVFERLEGFTIATEPKHCGGLIKSNSFLEKISKMYFEPELFTRGSDWKHKKSH